MKNEENILPAGTCGKQCQPCLDGTKLMKIAVDMANLSEDLALLTSCRYKMANESFKKFRIFRGIHLIWQAHCTHRLMLRLLKQSFKLSNVVIDMTNKEVEATLKDLDKRLSQ